MSGATNASTWHPGRLDADVGGRRGLAGMSIVLRGYWRPFGVSVAFGVANQGLQVAAAGVGGYLVGLALTGAARSELLRLAWLLIALVVVRAIAVWAEAWVSHELAYRVLAEVRQWLYDAFVRLAPGKLADRRSGELVATAMADSEAMEMFYAHSLIYAVVAAIVPPAALVVLAVLHVRLAAVLLAFVLASVVVAFSLRHVNARHGQQLRRELADLNTTVTDLVAGLREVLTYDRGDAVRQQLRAQGRAVAHTQTVMALRIGAEHGSAYLLAGLGTLATLWVAAGLVETDELTLAVVPGAVALAACTFQPVLTLLGATRIWGVTTGAADRVFDLLEEPAAVPDTGELDVAPQVGPLVFDGVTYRYPDSQVAALDGVSFSIEPGEIVALVGHSGAGKTTCAQLLARFADPGDGRITYGWVDLRELTLDALYWAVAYVPQDVFLLHASIEDNLRLARPEASEAQLAAAVDRAGLTTVVAALERGTATIVGDRGARLSGGERQRVAIARAFLREAPVLVMDESTAMLDPLTEQELRDTLRSDPPERCTLLIAHRLSTVLAADRIVVLERGQVVATGSHDALLVDSDAYRRLVEDQWSGLAAVSRSDPEDPL
jgi:ATP-binding cassette subfamily C protein CydC